MLENDFLYSTVPILNYYALYALLCFPVVCLLVFFLPGRYRRTMKSNMLLFYGLALCVIGLGLVLDLILFICLHIIKPYKKKRDIIQSIEPPAFQSPPQTEFKVFGESSGSKIVTSDALSNNARKNTLVAINQIPSAHVMKINKLLLKDEADEVRLYAQSLIEKQERILFKMLKSFNKQMAKATNIKGKAYIEKQIALVLWEQVDKALVEEDSIMVALSKIKLYATNAFAVLNEDLELPLLMCGLYLKEERLDEANDWLNTAIKNQSSQYKIAFYDAEIAFKEKNYAKLRGIMKRLVNKGIIEQESLILFWSQGD